MFRLIGFLIGSVASVVIILLLIGVPNLELPDQQADQRRFDEAIEKLKAKQSEFESVADRLSEDMARVSRTVSQDVKAGDDGAMGPDEFPVTANADDAADAVSTAAAAPPASPSGPGETMWYSFWNPFRSEIAANGFVAQLERVTGLDYRVVKVRTGVYEVAFPYRDDEERRSRILQISEATGLDLPES
jgi:hypothetical protein